MLRLTRRAGTKIYYVRGTIKVGAKSLAVYHSTGLTNRALADKYKATYQRDEEEKLIGGATFVRRQISFAAAALDYLKIDQHASDVSRVRQLEKTFLTANLADIDAAAFAQFTRDVLPGRSPNTHERHRGVLAAIFDSAGMKFPEIPSYGEDVERVRWLPHAKADWFLRWYNPHVAPIARVARECGLRTSENVLIEVGRCDPSWGAHGAFHVTNPKNGRDRIVPWTADVRIEVLPRLHGRRDSERLWIGKRGPYADTRRTGGNPVGKAHATACRDAGISDFTFHDWRHHFATWALQKQERGGRGWDLHELQKVGGWKDLKSVQRYAAVMLDSIAESFETTCNIRGVA